MSKIKFIDFLLLLIFTTSGMLLVFEFVTNNTAAIVEEYEEAAFKTKEQHMADYIKSMKALEDAMEPYKEQKQELKKLHHFLIL